MRKTFPNCVMPIILPLAVFGVLSLTLATRSMAECTYPPHPPAMPQGATATDEEMKEGREDLQKYVNILQDYQNCMDKQIRDAPLDTKAEVKRRWAEQADAAVDAAHQIADIYALQLRVFKSRQ